MEDRDLEPLNPVDRAVVRSSPVEVASYKLPIYITWAAFLFLLQAILLLLDLFVEVRGVSSLFISRILLVGMWACASLVVFGWFHNTGRHKIWAFAVCIILAIGFVGLDYALPVPDSQTGEIQTDRLVLIEEGNRRSVDALREQLEARDEELLSIQKSN